MRHRRYDRLGCPVEACTEVIGGKWKGEILFILFSDGTKRHSELRKLIPDTTQRMLTTQLRELEEDGVIERKVYAQVPPKVEYSISKRGQALKPIIDARPELAEELCHYVSQMQEFLASFEQTALRPVAAQQHDLIWRVKSFFRLGDRAFGGGGV